MLNQRQVGFFASFGFADMFRFAQGTQHSKGRAGMFEYPKTELASITDELDDAATNSSSASTTFD
jgi:hypothetical protein